MQCSILSVLLKTVADKKNFYNLDGKTCLVVMYFTCIQCSLWEFRISLLQAEQESLSSCCQHMILVIPVHVRHQIFNQVPWWLRVSNAHLPPPRVHCSLDFVCQLEGLVLRAYVERIKQMIRWELLCIIHVSVDCISHNCFPTLSDEKIEETVSIKHLSLAGFSSWEETESHPTLGREAMYDSGICISARMPLFIAIAALWIWLARSCFCLKCFLLFSERPPWGTQGTGSHHFSSFLWGCGWTTFRKDPERVEFPDMLPCSAYQNSVTWKLSSISCSTKTTTSELLSSRSTTTFALAEVVLTRSIASSFFNAGRLMWMSDLGLLAITWMWKFHLITTYTKLWQEMNTHFFHLNLFTSKVVPSFNVCNEGLNSSM